MGYDMKEGTVVRWLKAEGDEVSRGEAVAEIETDKAVVEMDAYASGILRKIIVKEGATVPVGDPIGIIGTADEPLPDLATETKKTDEIAKAAPVIERPSEPEAKAEAPAPERPALEIKASPLARRLADEKGVDIRQIQGTGPGGRITKDDVLAYESRLKEKSLAEAPTPGAPEQMPGGTVSLTRMRQAIARLTTKSKQEVPHFYVSTDVDMTEAIRLRKQLNKALENGGMRISINDMIIKAVVKAIQKHPNFNSSFQGDHLQMHSSINIGMAVAVEEGLVVPAVMSCESKSLADIAKASKDLIDRAQNGGLRQDEYTQSTFSISNLGMFDVDSFVAIIHPPNAAVLAVGSIRKQPVVRDDQVGIADVMNATLSIDHRVADGAQAARFLSEVKRLLENPVSLLV